MKESIHMIDKRLGTIESVFSSRFINPEMERVFGKKVESNGLVADMAVFVKWVIKKASANLPRI